MPRLACVSCGRTLWATVPLGLLFAEERRCPRCGASLRDDRRVQERRLQIRRQKGEASASTSLERRLAERRTTQRRRAAV